jgi:hypothetical protein
MAWRQAWREADVRRQTSAPPHLTVWRQSRQLSFCATKRITVSDSVRVSYTTPPSPRSSLSHPLRSFVFLHVWPVLVSPSARQLGSTASDSIRVSYTPPPSSRPHSSLSYPLRSFGLLHVRPGLVSPVQPIDYVICFTRGTQCMQSVWLPQFWLLFSHYTDTLWERSALATLLSW